MEATVDSGVEFISSADDGMSLEPESRDSEYDDFEISLIEWLVETVLAFDGPAASFAN